MTPINDCTCTFWSACNRKQISGRGKKRQYVYSKEKWEPARETALIRAEQRGFAEKFAEKGTRRESNTLQQGVKGKH